MFRHFADEVGGGGVSEPLRGIIWSPADPARLLIFL